MKYREEKSKNFAAYCRDGKIKLVQRWIDNPNVDLNWNYNAPLRNAVYKEHFEIIELLLSKPSLRTDYENTRELKGEYNGVKMVFNPFTESFKSDGLKMVKYLIDTGKFKLDRKENLDALIGLGRQDIINLFSAKKEVVDLATKLGNEYNIFIPKELRDIFIF